MLHTGHCRCGIRAGRAAAVTGRVPVPVLVIPRVIVVAVAGGGAGGKVELVR